MHARLHGKCRSRCLFRLAKATTVQETRRLQAHPMCTPMLLATRCRSMWFRSARAHEAGDVRVILWGQFCKLGASRAPKFRRAPPPKPQGSGPLATDISYRTLPKTKALKQRRVVDPADHPYPACARQVEVGEAHPPAFWRLNAMRAIWIFKVPTSTT